MPESFILQGNKTTAGPACDRTNRLTESLELARNRLMLQFTPPQYTVKFDRFRAGNRRGILACAERAAST